MRNRYLMFVSLCLASAISAQTPKMEPGEAHRKLDFLVGEWTIEATMHMPDRVHRSEHTSEIRWLPGDVWLDEQAFMKDTPIGDIHGSSRIAWDAGNEQYVRTWIDGQSHITLPTRGNFIDEKTIEFKGSFEWIDGRVFHERILIRREADGWSQTGWMGSDPDAMRLNHESRARRKVTERATTAPEWFREHMAYLTRDGGRWITDNSGYMSENEPFDAYGVEWSHGIGKQSAVGRLFGLIDGKEQATFWEFRTLWNPASAEVEAWQYGGNGVVGVGAMTLTAPGRIAMEQTFTGPDGSQTRVGHEAIEDSAGSHVTNSFDIAEDGTRTPRRSYTWTLDR